MKAAVKVTLGIPEPTSVMLSKRLKIIFRSVLKFDKKILYLFFSYDLHFLFPHIPLLIFKQVPGLVTLKKLSCVSFAGVDSLDDVKNHTYNELFMSGGFVVSDESVLNPESITMGKCDAFWSFKTKKGSSLKI